MPRGSTAGIQQFLRAQGIEWGDSASHDYHLWFDGGTIFTDAQFVFGGLSPWVDALRYGADPSGSADSAGAIQAALNAAAASGAAGGTSTVFLAPGIYLLSTPLRIPKYVILRGSSTRGTYLRAKSTFATSTPLVYLGPNDTTSMFYCRVEDLTIDCSSIAGSIGVYSKQLNEMCGAKRLTVTNYMDKGLQIVADPAIVGGYNWWLEDLNLNCAATATGSFGVHLTTLTGGFGYGKVTRCTVVPNGGAVAQDSGIYAGGAGTGEQVAWLDDVHVELHTNGVHYDTGSMGNLSNLTVGGSSTNGALLDATRQVCLMGVRGTSVTNLIVDNRNSVTIAPFWYGFYSNHEAAFEKLFLNAAASRIVPGATSLTIRNNADSQNNVLISDAGEVSLRASTTATAMLNVPHGSAPSAPSDGDIWTTSAGLFVRINGSTIGPLS